MDNVISTYDAIAAQYSAAFSDPADFLDDFLGLLPPKASIVDAGCGPGVDLAYCSSKGFVAHGFDLSGEMVSLARKRNPDIKIDIADLLNFSCLPKVKACIASYSLIHLPKSKIPCALKNVRDSLEECGFLYIAVHEGSPCEMVLPEPFDPSLKIFLSIFSKEELTAYLVQAGFRVVETKSRLASSKEEFSYNKLVLFAQLVGDNE